MTVFTLAICVSAQTAKTSQIKLRNVGLGKISVSKGNLRSTIDLSAEVAGCAYVAGERKRELVKTECASPPASFKLLDATVKNNRTFLVVQSNAMGNCNVCGQCGATEAFALIWLNLDARLHVLDRKSVPIEDCRSRISLVNPVNDEPVNGNLNLPFKSDILSVEFETKSFDNNSSYEFSHLYYNRKTPENGFVINTRTIL